MKKKAQMDVKRILKELQIEGEVLNVYRYGSRVYGTDTKLSDDDFIIVMKSAFLDSGSFRDNAISNSDRTIQGILYSRGGFQDALNNYEIGALECLFLEEDDILKNDWNFRLYKFINKDMIKKIISKSSNSWHLARHKEKDGESILAKKGTYHALRILEFGLQLKEHQRIVDYKTVPQKYIKMIMTDGGFKMKNYIKLRDELIEKLRS